MSEPSYRNAPPSNFVLPFDLPEAGVRGRLVRLTAAPTRALGMQDLPEKAARIEGEAMALATILGSLLKLDGRLTVQTRTSGPLGMLVADYYGAVDDKPRGVRATARLDGEMLKLYGKNPSFKALVGKGALAITIRPRAEDKDYQGVVPLAGDADGLSPAAETYFRQSEQLASVVRLAAAPLYTRGEPRPSWIVGGILLQATPEAPHGEDAEKHQDWERLSILTASIEDQELLDTALTAETLLWRLYHQDEVRLQPFEPVEFRCDCATANIAAVLNAYDEAERKSLADADGFVRATCEFCGTVHAVKVI